ncbi:MAG: hypothetical protein MJ185_08930 [Treponema sp.]|nr:hypothetical protein [Treponema sp.]
MKKTIKVICWGILAFVMTKNVFAKESFSISGLWKTDSYRSGGAIEIGFPNIFESEKFFIRDSLELGGAGLFINMENPVGMAGVSNKMMFGSKKTVSDVYIKSYGFWTFGGDLFFPNAMKFSGVGATYGFDFGGGGGFEFGFEESNAGFVVEYGGGYCTKGFGYNSVNLGYRRYF